MNLTTRNSQIGFQIWLSGTKPGLWSGSRTRDLLPRVAPLTFALVLRAMRSKSLRHDYRVTCRESKNTTNSAIIFRPESVVRSLTSKCLHKLRRPNIKCRTKSIILNSYRCNNFTKCKLHNSNNGCRPHRISTNILSICNQPKFKPFLLKCLRYTTTISSLICKVMRIRLMGRKGQGKMCSIFSRTWSRSFPKWTSVIRTRI